MSRVLHHASRFVRARGDFDPAYLKAYEAGQLAEKVAAGLGVLHSCTVCPRHCRTNRWNNKRGLCNTGRSAPVSCAFAHFGEEECLVTGEDPGTIFFS